MVMCNCAGFTLGFEVFLSNKAVARKVEGEFCRFLLITIGWRMMATVSLLLSTDLWMISNNTPRKWI